MKHTIEFYILKNVDLAATPSQLCSQKSTKVTDDNKILSSLLSLHNLYSAEIIQQVQIVLTWFCLPGFIRLLSYKVKTKGTF